MDVDRYDLLEKYPALRGQVIQQHKHSDICWAIVGSFCVSAVCTTRSTTGLPTILATQDLIDNVFPNYPEGAATDLEGNVMFDRFNCCGMKPVYALKYVKKFGIMHESDYRFTGIRNLNPPTRPLDRPRVSLYRYRILNCFTDPYMPLTEKIAYDALRFGGPMMGTVFATPEFLKYRKGILVKQGVQGLHMPHSVSVVGMDRTIRCFKIQNSDKKWGIKAEGVSVGWILYELVYDLLQAGYTYGYIPGESGGGPEGRGSPEGSGGPRGSGGPGGQGSGHGGGGLRQEIRVGTNVGESAQDIPQGQGYVKQVLDFNSLGKSEELLQLQRKHDWAGIIRAGAYADELLNNQEMFSEIEDVGLTTNKVSVEYVNGVDVYGTGLKNEAGEFNCFLNVVIQSLWHIRRFRKDFLRRSALEHVHISDPCVICALYDVFNALNTASSNFRSEAVAPTSLRTALSNLYPESNFFQEAQMNDASEVLAVIFDCIHRSFTSGFGVSDTKSIESNGMGSWDCANNACVAHSLFGMNVLERLNCYNCGLESREMKYTSSFYNINASALRTMKVMSPESCFEELLSLVQRDDQFMCNPEVRGCGKFNYKNYFLSTQPHVFTAVLGWQNAHESVDDIRATLAALAMDIDIGVLYDGVDPKSRHRLISVVCFYGQHYHCFVYDHDHKRWIMYDDKTVELIGGWDDVIAICEKGHLQPQVLFFEAVN